MTHTGDAKPKQKNRYLSVILRAAVSCTLIAILLFLADTSEMIAMFAQIDPLPFVGACLAFAVGQWLSAVRWRVVIESAHAAIGGNWYYNGLIYIGLCFNFFLPSTVGGDVVRAELTKSRLGSRMAAYGGVLFDRFVAFLSVVALGLSALVIMFVVAGSFDPSLVVACGIFLLIAIAAYAVIRWPVIELTAPHFGDGRLRRIFDKINEMIVLLRQYIKNKNMFIKAFGLSLLIQIIGANLVIYFLAIALGIQVPAFFHFVAVPIITLVTLAPISLNGLGIREIAFVLLYAKVGVATEASVALSIAFTLVLAVFAAVGGLCIQIPGLYRPGVASQIQDE